MAPVSGASRPLTTDERRLLDAWLSHDFPGAGELRAQARAVTASRGCSCGCGTIELHVRPGAPASSAESPVPVEGTVHDDTGRVVGGLLLFVQDGLLSQLEVYPLDDGTPALPPPERVSWVPGG